MIQFPTITSEREKVLVTDGAGFIGSHLVERLINSGFEVTVIDNLSARKVSNLESVWKHPDFTFVRGDLLNRRILRRAMKGVQMVFHLAANPEVRIGSTDTSIDFEQNLQATYNLLEEMRKHVSAETIVFTSTSTVYGEPTIIPTPEDYGPLVPISLYGASKLGCEALVSAYCHLFELRAVIYRFANVVGARNRHGVIHDFIRKLRVGPHELKILGDGTQNKSYIHINDCVEAFFTGFRNLDRQVRILNVGSEGQTDVTRIARIVIDEMGLKDVQITPVGGFEGRGWKGDVKNMLLDIGRIKGLGWQPIYHSDEAIRLAAKETLKMA